MAEDTLMQKVFSRMKTDSAFRAALKKADNPDTEYQSWEYLADYGVNVQYENSRLPFATVFAAAARSDFASDGTVAPGKALCDAYGGDKTNTAARSKLRRLLACTETSEACSVLRPLLAFVTGKGVRVCLGEVLNDLRFFERNPEQTKAKWAQQFFGGEPE